MRVAREPNPATGQVLPMARIKATKGIYIAISVSIVVLVTVAVAIHQHERANDTADALLARADDLSWDNDWMAAAPLYARAERLFTSEGRPSQALYARVSQMIP